VSLPAPVPGLVIRYAYLWHREHRTGQEEGVKDRPCAIVMVVIDEDGDQRVTVLPITHTPPRDPTEAVELPPPTKRRLGLDEARSWIVLTEGNEFVWPGPDLRPLPGHGADSVACGVLPPGLFRIVRDRFLDLHRRRRSVHVPRSE
jgi:hypothetical protein